MQSYDYIVTGAGSAGCVIAARLTEDPDVRVLLLEAGGADDNRLFSIPAGFAKMTKGIASWGWSTTPQRHMNGRVFWYTQAKVLGGGSTINAQIYTRGSAAVYDAWASEHGCDGWSFREVLPYFRRAEDNQRLADEFHGTGGPLGVAEPLAPLPVAFAFLRAAQEYGIPFNPDFNGARQEGCGFYQVTQKNGRRSSTATAFLAPARKRKNLTVATGAEARRIVVENGRAVGVDYARGAERLTARADREVVVTSGAIGSPRLLMLSGIGPADHVTAVGVTPVHDLQGVGANLHDHIDLFVISECSGRHSYDHYAKPHYAALAGLEYYLFGRGPAASSLFETGGFWRTDPAGPAADLQFHFGQGSGIEAGVAAMKNGGVTLNAAHVQPRSRGSVRLASADPKDAPLIDPNYWADPDDRRRAIEGLRIARDIMGQPALAPYLKAERLPGPEARTDAELAAYACANAKTQHHPVGSCRMGTDAMAVVDPQLRLRGLDGLRVCDASIMPRITSSNTNAPAIMIGEKAADLLRGNRAPPA